MTRVSTSATTRARHKKFLALAKGQYGRRSRTYRTARESAEKALQYAYRDRRTRKRDMRSLWIQRLNASCRGHGWRYGDFIHALSNAEIEVDRKQLSDLAILHPEAFASLLASLKND